MAEESATGSRPPSFDRIWERIYAREQQLNRYPFDGVVAFIFEYCPRSKPRGETRIVEVGFGAANNLWFAAREGFQVAGVDASPSAAKYARNRFIEDDLSGDLRVGDFTDLPFEDNSFDMAINRAAITQTGRTHARQAVDEVHRVLRPGGQFFNEFYSDRSTSRGCPGGDGVTVNIEGPLSGIGQVCFYDRVQLESLFGDKWTIAKLSHVERTEVAKEPFEVLATWSVIAVKRRSAR